jgi:aspartyl-tRNA(Asn)/glutamyl-tRNA(Gln) amidotransferase subunit A
MREVSLPDMPYGDVISTIIEAEGATIFESLIKSNEFESLADEKQKASLRAALDIPAKDYLNAMRIRRIMQEKIRMIFRDVDVILTVARAGPATGINELISRPAVVASAGTPRGNTGSIPAGNLAGLPAISLPCGFADGTKLPVAVQLLGRPFDELTLVTLGREFQKQTDWHRRRPPVA